MGLSEFGTFEVDYYDEGEKIRECWLRDRVAHRIGKPAIIYYDNQSREEVKRIYKVDGLTHRERGPAIEEINPTNGIVYREQHMRFGQLDRSDGPAVVIRDRESGEVLETQFYSAGSPIAPPKDEPSHPGL